MVGSMPLNDNSLVIALLKALANEQRLLIVKMLMKGERNVGEIESCLTLTQSAFDPPPINESRNSYGNAIHNGLIKGGAGYGTQAIYGGADYR